MPVLTLPLSFTSLSVTELGQPIEPVTRTITALSPEEIIARVHYASINPMDSKLQQENFFQLPMPLALGFDFSGVVEAVGSGVSDLAVGDEVFGFSPSGGCYAEYVKVPRMSVAKRGEVPLREAAAYGIAYPSAYEPLFMVDDMSKRKGQTIYVAGGAGGVGHFAVQLAKAHGLTVHILHTMNFDMKLSH